MKISNRAWWSGVVICCCCILSSAVSSQSDVQKVVKARRVEIADAAGRSRIVLSVDDGQIASIDFVRPGSDKKMIEMADALAFYEPARNSEGKMIRVLNEQGASNITVSGPEEKEKDAMKGSVHIQRIGNNGPSISVTKYDDKVFRSAGIDADQFRLTDEKFKRKEYRINGPE